ncbi:MAG: serine/threonine-protein kinase, partial [Planctomycetota bacterium]
MADPEELFAEYLAAQEAGEAVDFEALCAAHPEAADELRELKDLEARFASVISGGDLSGTGSALTSALSDLVRAEEPEVEQPETERYDVIGEVGRGGMGVVLEVFDRALRRRSAMKIVRPGGGQQQMRRLARFLEEAQLTGQLEHPGIVPVHELGTDDEGCTYFTMRLVEGVTLSHVFEEVRKGSEQWTLPRALGVLQRVCETLAYAHSRGVIHRDLKPSNVMVGRFGETYVMDWGLATPEGAATAPSADSADLSGGLGELDESLSRSGLGLTLAGDVVGTPAYMAPEQAGVGDDAVGPRSDVYALGAMLYELLSGSAPYVEQGHAMGMLEALRKGPPKDLAKRVDDVAPELVAIAAKAMRRDP